MSALLKVVVTDYVWESLEVEREILAGVADIVALQTKDPERFLAEAADCDALLTTYAGPIDAAVMGRMPRCRIVARYGIGVDTIDLEAATRLGIIVTNNPSYCVEDVAEHTLALVLACARKVVHYDRSVREGAWAVTVGKPIFRVGGSTLGLIGFGAIAREVARRAAALGMRVLFSDPGVGSAPHDIAAKKVKLETVLGESDFVSIHAPLTPETRGLISFGALARMKRSAFLINCARGPIVDTSALLGALEARRIAGCALDTADPEPLPEAHPLRTRDDVILTPHAAWYSEQAMVGLQSGAPSEVRRVLTGAWPVNVVNPAVRGRNRAELY